MPPRIRRRDAGKHQADRLLARLADELRTARMEAGLGLRDVAREAGISKSQLHRYEHARVSRVALRDLVVLFAVLGKRLSARPYPEGPPLRDVAHARLLARFKAELSPTIRMRTEVPLRLHGELRALDAELEAGGETCKLEAETSLYDLQATDRRIALKMADDHVEQVILLVADTRRNRRVLREFRSLVEARYPAGTREAMRRLRAGRLPARSGLVLR